VNGASLGDKEIHKRDSMEINLWKSEFGVSGMKFWENDDAGPV